MKKLVRNTEKLLLCPDSHLCHICCHVLNRLWLFRSVCLKRSLEYPVLFSEKGTLNLQRNDLELYTICAEDTCEHYKSRNLNSKFYNLTYFNEHYNIDVKDQGTSDYVELYEDFDFDNIIVTKYKQQFDTINEQVITDAINDIKDTDQRCNFDDHKSVNNDEISNCDNVSNNEELAGVINGDVNFEVEYNRSGHDDNDISITDKEQTVEDDKVQDKVKHKKRKVKKKINKINKKFEKIILTVDEQKAELERNRRDEKYLEAEFKCSNCALGFLFKDTYQAHMMRHEESNGEHRCNLCTLRFANPAVLRSHIGLHSERYKCIKCDIMVRKRQRTSHATDCYDLKVDAVACHLCGRVFKDSNGVQQHLKRFHRSQPTKSYSCSVCLQRFSNPAAVRTHMIKHISRAFPCPQCTAVFSSPHTLRQHRRTHATNVHPQAQLACHLCRNTYSGRKSLLAHVRNVHLKTKEEKKRSRSSRPRPARASNPLAICHLCGASFKGNSKLNRHLREVCDKNRLEEEFSTYYTQDAGV